MRLLRGSFDTVSPTGSLDEMKIQPEITRDSAANKANTNLVIWVGKKYRLH